MAIDRATGRRLAESYHLPYTARGIKKNKCFPAIFRVAQMECGSREALIELLKEIGNGELIFLYVYTTHELSHRELWSCIDALVGSEDAEASFALAYHCGQQLSSTMIDSLARVALAAGDARYLFEWLVRSTRLSERYREQFFDALLNHTDLLYVYRLSQGVLYTDVCSRRKITASILKRASGELACEYAIRAHWITRIEYELLRGCVEREHDPMIRGRFFRRTTTPLEILESVAMAVLSDDIDVFEDEIVVCI